MFTKPNQVTRAESLLAGAGREETGEKEKPLRDSVSLWIRLFMMSFYRMCLLDADTLFGLDSIVFKA